MAPSLETLAGQRELISNKLERISTYVSNPESQTATKYELEARIKQLENLWNEFDSIQNEIEIKTKTDKIQHNSDRNQFELIYFQCIAYFKTRLDNVCSRLSALPTHEPQIEVKLPSIDLPKFAGNYANWLTFADTFRALIDNNTKLNNVQRYHYLKSCLVGEASKIIANLPIAEHNYTTAWNLLSARFQNTKLIIKTHVNSLFNLPSQSKPSSCHFRQLIDTVTSNLNSLEKLELTVDSWGPLIVHLVVSRLDYRTAAEWEQNAPDIPKWEDLSNFLYKKCQTMDAMDTNFHPSTASKSIGSKPKLSANVINSSKVNCPLCNKAHNIQNCEQFLSLSPENKLAEIQKLQRCTNCLRYGHKVSNCQSGSCRRCNKRHHTLLHFEETNNVDLQPSTSSSLFSVGKPTTFGKTILSTALVHINDLHGHIHSFKAVLDSGSQASFITQKAVQILGCKTKPIKQTITGIGQSNTKINKYTTVEIRSRLSPYKEQIDCLVMPQLTQYTPDVSHNIKSLQIPQHVKLADPEFFKIQPIDIILGNELFFKLLCIGQIQLGAKLPTLQNTKLGWIVAGQWTDHKTVKEISCHLTNALTQQELTRFWELDQFQSVPHSWSPEDEKCERLFLESHTRLPSGHFMVRLPFKTEPINLGSTREVALKRLKAMERKFATSKSFCELYHEFIVEYRDLQHMELITHLISNPDYILPHHAVLRDHSATTKLRVVFDASVKSINGTSLNDNLLIGPPLQNDLFKILIQFRRSKFVISADITKMYRQIFVHPNDRQFQCILWRDNPTLEPSLFQLNTVTYGTSCAPYLAIRCLHQLADEHSRKFPQACLAIKNNFYVDDLLVGSDNLTELIQLKTDITHILNTGGFSLAKWSSNHPDLLSNSEPSQTINIHKDDTRTLGIQWNFIADEFQFDFTNSASDRTLTKRQLLSNIAKMFDPLGLLGPLVTKAKIIMQQLWVCGVDWDQPVPLHIYTIWKQFSSEISLINNIRIPRRILTENTTSIHLCGFSDASETAYGACLYARHQNSDGTHSSRLITSKSKVAPLKKTTLPRLELCGALLLAQLSQKLKEMIQIPFKSEQYWSDSTIVLAWIATPSHLLKTFVANRVSQIQSITSSQSWNHIRSPDNPADLISRGTNPSQLINNNLWWHGPAWLQLSSSQWPSQPKPTVEAVPELKPNLTVNISAIPKEKDICKLINKYSRLTKLKRVVAYCLRFKHNSLNRPENRKLGPLSSDELDLSLVTILKIVQQNAFYKEINTLNHSHPLPTKSSILALSPFLDRNGLLRVGGRLKHANLDYDAKHPILIPRGHHVTTLILRDKHEAHYHINPLTLLNVTRAQYWPIAGRSTARKVVRDCVICAKINAKPQEPYMANLPPARLKPGRPFSTCGIDYAGPFSIREGRTRGRKIVKAYLCLFVCFTTRAVHLEVVSGLSTEAFLSALRRFVARRGLCTDIYSDNATNFVGANNQMKEWANLLRSSDHRDSVANFLAEKSIKWHFIPARSPHFGGLWEAGIKSAKRLFYNLFSNAFLTFEELSTVFTEIEAILNSRPLSPLSSDPSDPSPLTPAHFLTGDSLLTIPSPDLTDLAINRLRRFQLLQRLHQEFWKRWSRDYLTTLQTRNKWRQSNTIQLTPGTMVILKESNPPLMWRLGKIIQSFPGDDGVVRVVSVQTSGGVVKRSVHKLCVLPMPVTTPEPKDC